MSLILGNCIEFEEKRKFCIASENKKVYRIENSSNYTIRKVVVDGCLNQKAAEKRCDFLFSIDNDDLQRVIFVELKGGALSKALEQLLETIQYLKNEFVGYRIDARIVGSRDVPDLKSTPTYRKLAVLVSRNNGTLERATNNIYTEII